jgi:hypothetical protein
MRFSKADILQAFEREDRSYRLGIMCTHWIRDVERYKPNAADLAPALSMQAAGRWISYGDLAPLLSDPMKREILIFGISAYISTHANPCALRIVVRLL